MAQTKIPRIDALFESLATAPLSRQNAAGQEAAVGIVQELLTCQDYAGSPVVRQVGIYGKSGQEPKRISSISGSSTICKSPPPRRKSIFGRCGGSFGNRRLRQERRVVISLSHSMSK